MPSLSYLKAINRALGDEMARDPAVFVLGEDVGEGLTNATVGLLDRFGAQRVVEAPISEQGFTDFATGAALGGRRPVVEFQVPFLLLLVLEQIANQSNKISLMSGGQAKVPVTYLLTPAGRRPAGALSTRISRTASSGTSASRPCCRPRQPTPTDC